MDDWFDSLREIIPATKQSSTHIVTDDAQNPWLALFQQHPEGGGAYGGRDNAMTVLVGFFRAKGFPLEAALEFGVFWNKTYCFPPLEEVFVRERIARGWIEWLGGTIADNTPDSTVAEVDTFEVLTFEDMKKRVAEKGELAWLVDNVLLDSGLAFVSAPAGGGKSWLAADLVRCCSNGDYWLGHLPTQVCNVLYIDEEMGVTGMFHRLDGLRANPETLSYTDQQGIKLDNPIHMKKILQIIDERSIRLVIIDTFVRVHQMDENDNSRMSQLYGSFKQIKSKGCAILCLHHNRKSGSESGIAHEQMRGAGDIAAQADTVFSISKQGQIYTMRTTKNRHGQESEHINISWTVDTFDGKTTINPVEAKAIDIDMRQQVLNVVPVREDEDDMETDGLLTGNDIHKRTGGNRTSCLRAVKDLANEGLLGTVSGARRAVYYFKRVKTTSSDD